MKKTLLVAVIGIFVLASFVGVGKAADVWPSYERNNWADVRAVTACGVSFGGMGIDEGMGLMNLSELRAMTELENFRRVWMLPQDSTILCEMAYRLMPDRFENYYWPFMKVRFPQGWPGKDIPLKKKVK